MLAVSLPQPQQQPSSKHETMPSLRMDNGPVSVSEKCQMRKYSSGTHASKCTHRQECIEQPSVKEKREPSVGVCFDVDGVLAHGTRPISRAPEAIRRLTDTDGEFRVPVAFVTNSLSSRADKANKLSELLGVQIRPEQMILAPGPLQMFTELHDKFCLVVGQGKILEIAAELGFKSLCTIEDIARTYPLLDVADHENRKRNEKLEEFHEPPFRRIEAVVLLGEPRKWESALQLLIDVLLTGGRPYGPRLPVAEARLPVIACNMDLEFKDRASTPRFGHGAFLNCLESLYEKLTGQKLQYEALVGKPSEITFRFAEHILDEERQRLNFKQPIDRMYLIGDTPEVDIVGSNLYQRLIDQRSNPNNVKNKSTDGEKSELPASRNFPSSATLHKHTVTSIHSILVCTGVYRPSLTQEPRVDHVSESHHGHRDFPHSQDLQIPTKICRDVSEAIDYIINEEAL